MPFELDPVCWHAARWLVAGVFVIGAAHKLASPSNFSGIVRDYRLVPAGLAAPAALAIVGAELAVVAALVTGLWIPAAALLAAGLLGLYAAAIGINLVRGRRDIDCGCFGPAGDGRKHRLSGGLLGRNTLLAVVCLSLLLSPGPRALGWLDLVTIGFAATAALALYAAADQLLANRPLIARLVG